MPNRLPAPSSRSPSRGPSSSAPERRGGRRSHYVLDAQEVRFVEEYLIDLDHRAAAERAGYPNPLTGSRLLATPRVQSAIALAKRRRLSRLQIYGDQIVRRWDAIANADVNELVESRRVNCRNCHGRDHEHRWDEVEYRALIRAHNAALDAYDALPSSHRDPTPGNRDFVPPPVLDERGGSGFRPNDPPHPDCPKCGGDGVLKVVVKDSRYFSPAAKLLYDGVEVVQGNVKMKIRDRSWAEQQLARHAGLFNERTPVEEFDPNRMSDDQLDAVLSSMVERGVVELEGEYEEVSHTSSSASSEPAPSEPAVALDPSGQDPDAPEEETLR